MFHHMIVIAKIVFPFQRIAVIIATLDVSIRILDRSFIISDLSIVAGGRGKACREMRGEMDRRKTSVRQISP